MTNLIRPTLSAVALALAGLVPAAQAQAIRVAEIVELSGAGATSGANSKNGVELAVREINAAGGILGRKIETTVADTQSNPGVVKGLAQKAGDDEVFAVFAPVFSGSILVSMAETRRAEIPNFTGGEAASITKQGNPCIFRTSFTQNTAMPKVARYMAHNLEARTMAVIYVNNDFGKGGRDAVARALETYGAKMVAAIEKAGKFDRKLVAQNLPGLSLKAAQHPGILMDVAIDDKGDLDRESFLVEARDGRQIVKEILPALGAK
ncbi:MAG: hypothetical protein RLZZ584_3357 [Pseudomonadota bacterium]